MAWTSGKNFGATLHAAAKLFTNIHQLKTAVTTQRLINMAKTVTKKHRPKLTAKTQNEFMAKQKIKLKLVQTQADEILRKSKP